MYIKVTLEINDRCLLFGKYKNISINDILQSDPSYLEWCINNIKGFEYELTENEKHSINKKIDEVKKIKRQSNIWKNTFKSNNYNNYDYPERYYYNEYDDYEASGGVWCQADM